MLMKGKWKDSDKGNALGENEWVLSISKEQGMSVGESRFSRLK